MRVGTGFAISMTVGMFFIRDIEMGPLPAISLVIVGFFGTGRAARTEPVWATVGVASHNDPEINEIGW